MKTNKIALIFASIIILVLIYAIPRFFTALWGESDPWTSFWYHYSMGFIVFGLGIWLIKKSKAYNPERAQDRFWFKTLWIGFALYFFGQMGWILLAQNFAVRGM